MWATGLRELIRFEQRMLARYYKVLFASDTLNNLSAASTSCAGLHSC